MTSEPGHVHDATCGVAHGHEDAAPAADRVLVAVYASPVAAALLRFGAECGYRPVLLEPDPAVAAPGGLPAGTATVRTIGEVATAAGGDALAHADVVVCDHHRDDLGVPLRDALDAGVRWVGIMGNPRHEGPHVAALASLGVPPDDVARVHRPIGLDIGSRSPAEIAVSTLAGLLADRNGRSGGVYTRA